MNPLSTHYDLISIATPSEAQPDVKHYVINAKEKGGKTYNEFQKSRIEEIMHIRTASTIALDLQFPKKNKKRKKFLEKMSFEKQIGDCLEIWFWLLQVVILI